MFFFFFSAGKIEKNNLGDIVGSEVGLNVDWLKEKKNFSVLPPMFSCVPMHNSRVRGVWQSARPRILHLSDRLYCIQTSVAELTHRAAAKSCLLDPMPTSVVLKVIDVLLPVITSLINLSFEKGHFAME